MPQRMWGFRVEVVAYDDDGNRLFVDAVRYRPSNMALDWRDRFEIDMGAMDR